MAVASYMPGRCIPILIYHSARKWNKGVRLWSPRGGGGNGWQLMSSMKYIYTCYCLTLDWMNVNIWVQDCCLLGKRAQKSISISEFGSCSEPCEEVKVIAVGKQEATPPPIPYTLLLQYQFTAPGEARGISRVWWWWWGVCFFITTCSGHSVCESWCKARHADGTALR